MKTWLRRIGAFLIVAVVAYNIGTWGYLFFDYFMDRHEAETAHYVSFYSQDDETIHYSSDIEQYENYRSQYDYNDRVYYNTLSDKAKRIYHFFEYALDYARTDIRIDARLLPEEIEVKAILHYLALDSAMVDQNLWQGIETDTSTLHFDTLFDFEKEFEFCQIHVGNFAQKHLEKKKQAIAAAEKVVAAMPKGLTDREKVTYLYDYLGKNVVYSDKEIDKNVRVFLHEALCEKHTNCDGYANAFAMMCNMADIPCFEKLYLPGEDAPEEESGHTWTCVKLDGVWYNIDPTASPNILEDTWYADIRYRLGYSDSRQADLPLYHDILPACEKDLHPADLAFTSTADSDLVKRIGVALTARPKRDPLVVSFENYDKDRMRKAMQQVSNTYHIGTSRVAYETHGGEHIVFIIRK